MGAESPRFVRLEDAEGLEGPGGLEGVERSEGSEAAGTPGAHLVRAMTGGGLVGLVDPVRGLQGVWRGEEPVAGALSLHAADPAREGSPELPPERAAPSGPTFRHGPGSWERTLPLPGGGSLEERGLVPDVEGGVVLQWTLRPDPTSADPDSPAAQPNEPPGPAPPRLRLTGSLTLPSGTAVSLPPLELAPGAARAVLLVPPGVDPEGARRRLTPLRAREVQRGRRGRPDDGEAFSLVTSGARAAPLTEALALLDDAASGLDDEGRPRPPFLAGVGTEAPGVAPVLLRGTALAEVGIGALLAGRHELARGTLEALARETPAPPPLHLVFLAARWALWSGRPQELLSLEEVLAAAVAPLLRMVEEGPGEGTPESAPAGSAFPSPGGTLELLADGLEPLGEARWGEELRRRAREGRAAREGRGISGGRTGRSLPVLGQAPAGPEPAVDETDPTLPPPEAFGPPDAPGQRRAATLRAARIVRSWVEGVLGAEADAAYGRLTLAPRIERGTERLTVQGLRVGDGSVSLDCRRQGTSCTFLLRQDLGRVPLNLIFAPRLSMRGVTEVRIGDEPGDVEVSEAPDGVVVRCQFPLDPERRITIVGSD
jgi:hypothetical protein